jgi:hypothetical protein
VQTVIASIRDFKRFHQPPNASIEYTNNTIMSGSSTSKWGDVIGNKQVGIDIEPQKGLAKLHGKPNPKKNQPEVKGASNQASEGNGNKKPKKTSVRMTQQYTRG